MGRHPNGLTEVEISDEVEWQEMSCVMNFSIHHLSPT